MVCRGPERLYCRSREAPAGRDASARRTAEAAHTNRVPRPPRLRRRRRGSGPPVLSTPAASTIPRGRTLSARPRLHRRVRLLPAPLPYTPLTIPIENTAPSGAGPASDCEGACHGVRRQASTFSSMMLGLSALTFAPASFIVSLTTAKQARWCAPALRLRILQPIRVQRGARCGPARCDGDVRSFGDARFLLGH